MSNVSNESLIAMQKFRERVELKKEEVVNMWRNPPPPVMLAYGAVVLTSGVLFSAIGQWNVLGNFAWSDGLTSLLNLEFGTKGLEAKAGSQRRVKDILTEVAKIVGLSGDTLDDLNNQFLQLVQWNVIEDVNLHLSEQMRDRLADVLRAGGSDEERSKSINDFLKGAAVDAYQAKGFLDYSVEKSLLQLSSVFEKAGYQGVVDKVKELITV